MTVFGVILRLVRRRARRLSWEVRRGRRRDTLLILRVRVHFVSLTRFELKTSVSLYRNYTGHEDREL